MITVSSFRSFIAPVWEQKADAVVEYSRDLGVLVLASVFQK